MELLMEGPQLFTKLAAHLRVTPIAICLESNTGKPVQLMILRSTNSYVAHVHEDFGVTRKLLVLQAQTLHQRPASPQL